MRKGEYPEILKLSAVTYGEYNQQEIDVIIQRFTSFDRRKDLKRGLLKNITFVRIKNSTIFFCAFILKL